MHANITTLIVDILSINLSNKYNLDINIVTVFIKDFLTKNKEIKRAICITLGEQSENHVGMVKQGYGLADKGFSHQELVYLSEKFEKLGGKSELINLSRNLNDKDNYPDAKGASVLILRNGNNILLGKSSNMMKELESIEWDKTYYDTRRGKVLNKLARWNMCSGKISVKADIANKKGTIIGYDKTPIMTEWKNKIEAFTGQNNLEAEGNFYYDLLKTGIGFHGDAERKKIIASNICDEGVIREIHWQWYKDSTRVGNRIIVELYNNDCYIMSEKATGFDWKKRKIYTVRHAAGVNGSKYLK